MRDSRARWLIVALTVVAADAAAQADIARPRDVLHFMTPPRELRATATKADTNIIYMNPCLPNGCKVTVGNTDDRVDTSDIATQNGTLTAWSYGDASWQKVMTCMKATFSRFNVVITDVDPGMSPHYEVMVAGSPEQIMGNQGFGIGGVADFPCQDVGNCDPFLPNALVFDFADVFGNDPTEICAVAAQEIAHTWALDHVVDPTDPLTYNNYNGMRTYHDGEKCGSDCQGGKSPFGLTCTGSGGQASHTCSGNGKPTQDEVQTMLALFGPSGPPTPPTVSITSPSDGATVTPQFMVKVNATDDQGVDKVELRIDGSLVGTAISKAPYQWAAPASLAQGSHQIKATAYDVFGATADATITVTEGNPCSQPSDCPMSNDTCVDGRCVPGPNDPHGLGQPCMVGTDCSSGICANDTSGDKVCVEDCDPAKNGCPSGFSCIAAGNGGVCWPTGGNGDQSGGCSTSDSDGSGLALIGLGLGAIVIAGRRRRR
jgi:hypothetical protein